MALKVGELFASLRLDQSAFNTGLGSAESRFAGLGSAVAGVTAGIVASTGVALGAVAGIAGAVGVNYNAMMETSAVAWETILGDAQKAEDTIKLIERIGATTPFEFEGLDKTSKLLTMAGMGGEDLEKNLIRVGDAVSAVGGGQEELQGVAMALFQIGAKGKISAEEMNQMAERGLPVWDMLASAMGKSVPELMKMSENGELMADVALPKLIEGFGRFDGAMEKSATTFNGMKSTMMDNLKMLAGEITKGLFNSMKGAMPIINDFLSGLVESIKANGIKEAILGLFPEEVRTKITNIATSAQGFMDKLSEAKPYVMEFASFMAQNFQTIMAVVTPIIQFIGQQVMSVVSMILSWWKTNGSELLANFQTVFNAIWAVIQFVMPAIFAIISSVMTTIKGFIQGVLNVISGIFKIFAGLLTGDMGKMWEGVKQLFVGALQAIWNGIQLMFIGKLIGSLKAGATSIITNFRVMWANGKDIFMNALNAIRTNVSGFITSVRTYFTNMGNQIVQIWTWLRLTGANIFSALVNTILSVIRNLWSQAVSVVRAMGTAIYNAFNSMMTSARSIISSGASAIVNFFSNMRSNMASIISSARSAVVNTMNSIGSALKGLGSKAVGWGRDVMMGFFNGISAGAQKVLSKAKEIANSVGNTIKKALKINSPSKVTTQLGMWTGKGMEVGLDGTAKRVAKSAKALAKSATPNMQGVSSGQFGATLAKGAKAVGGMVHTVIQIGDKEIANAVTPRTSKNQVASKNTALRAKGINTRGLRA